MKAIVLTSILSSFRSRKDKSIGFCCATPELTVVEKVALMDLEGINVRLLIEPLDYATDGKVEVKSPLDTKTPSERLRAVLYCAFCNEKPQETFATWYSNRMEKLINQCKAELPPQ